jgi:hypothetical protein
MFYFPSEVMGLFIPTKIWYPRGFSGIDHDTVLQDYVRNPAPVLLKPISVIPLLMGQVGSGSG